MAEGFQIIIPFHGAYKALRDCIGSIFLKTRHIPFKITVVDDASPNKEFFSTIAQMDKQIDGIRSEEHKGFGASINEAIKLTKEPWLVFLNSDCIITEMDWLLHLYNALKDNMKNKVGLVSATMNNGVSSQLIERDLHSERSKNVIIATEPLPLICTLAPRKLFDRIGLLKEYPYGCYEDEELFYRMKKYGYKQAICEKSWVFHHGGLTTKALWDANPDIKRIMLEENHKKCAEDLSKIIIN